MGSKETTLMNYCIVSPGLWFEINCGEYLLHVGRRHIYIHCFMFTWEEKRIYLCPDVDLNKGKLKPQMYP